MAIVMPQVRGCHEKIDLLPRFLGKTDDCTCIFFVIHALTQDISKNGETTQWLLNFPRFPTKRLLSET